MVKKSLHIFSFKMQLIFISHKNPVVQTHHYRNRLPLKHINDLAEIWNQTKKDGALWTLLKSCSSYMTRSDLGKARAITVYFWQAIVSYYWQCNNECLPSFLYTATIKKLRFDCKELSLETICQCLTSFDKAIRANLLRLKSHLSKHA